jgi:hypothetical protein
MAPLRIPKVVTKSVLSDHSGVLEDNVVHPFEQTKVC